MTEQEAREWLQSIHAKRRQRAELNRRIRDAAYRGDWDELDRITTEDIGLEEPIRNGTWEDPGVA